MKKNDRKWGDTKFGTRVFHGAAYEISSRSVTVFAVYNKRLCDAHFHFTLRCTPHQSTNFAVTTMEIVPATTSTKQQPTTLATISAQYPAELVRYEQPREIARPSTNIVVNKALAILTREEQLAEQQQKEMLLELVSVTKKKAQEQLWTEKLEEVKQKSRTKLYLADYCEDENHFLSLERSEQNKIVTKWWNRAPDVSKLSKQEKAQIFKLNFVTRRNS